ncbi:MAG: Stp1/IreP family PP2C-type Ser/Thr phosphatase [Clostridiales bacterium]|nr:Stp1/IreP family PP2C-type Ser/Thr phosphatase [Clostridiales bacterium]
MLIRYSTGTDKGKVRDRNEDDNVVIDCDSYKVFAVADGMGGMDFGDLASSIAIEYIKKELSDCKKQSFNKSEIKKQFTRIFNNINNEIIKKCFEKKSVTGMGTTLSVCIVTDDMIYLGHIGDSRVYIIREGKAIQITKDHSYVEELIDSGRITKEQAKSHPNRNIITRALGLDREIDVDIDTFDLIEGDIVVLCTDGLTNAVEDQEIVEITIEASEPEEAVGKLIYKAIERGGKDNITVQLFYKEE